MNRRKCTVEIHLDWETDTWCAHCDFCRLSAAADDMAELKRLVRQAHRLPFLWDLCIDNRPAAMLNTSSSFEFTVDWRR